MSWRHYNPVRVMAGPGQSKSLGSHLPDGPLLLLTTAGMARRHVVAALMAQVVPERDWTMRFIAANPDLDELDTLAGQLRGQHFGAIVALGGGSVIDAAKTMSVLLPATGERVLHETLRNERALDYGAALRLICLPTTAGTGAEVTPFATIWDGEGKQKYSLSDEALFPRLTILDPELTLMLPWQETLYSALDASSHALETLWNRDATPISGAFALQALQKIVDNLPLVQADPMALAARSQLQEASLLAGLAISQNRTALAHSISYPLTARFGVPHGLACSFTLPALTQWVKTESAWTVALPDALRQTIVQQLISYQLGQQVLRYCSHDQVIACLGEMFNPQRARNFAMTASADDVLRILNDSLQ